MTGLPAADRLAPVIAGVAGLAWFWAELAPQRAGFEDTDNPATGLAFIAAHPEAWQQAGLALIVVAVALIATVLAMRERLLDASRVAGSPGPQVAVRTISTIGLLAAAMLFAMGCVRLSGGPVLYVRSLDQEWGEMAYTVTQFVGTQLLLVGGLLALALWIAGVAIAGGRRGVVPRLIGILALLPCVRLLALPGLDGIIPEGFWFVLMAAIPSAFVWLILLGAWRPSPAPARVAAADAAAL